MAKLNQLIEERPAVNGGAPGGFVHILFAVVLVSATLYFARVVIEPIAFAFLGIALVWPIQKALERVVPKAVALLLTILLTLIVLFAFASAIIWSVDDIVHWILANLPRFQSLYMRTTQWLEGQGVFVTVGIEQYDVRSFVGFLQDIALKLNSFAGFCVVVFLLLTFGLRELTHSGTRFRELEFRTGWNLAQISQDIAKKIRTYMLIRTISSLLTGTAVFIYTMYLGLDLAIAWGVISFILNYIPYIGALIAVALPVLFSAVQFESWQIPAALFGGLYLIQFLIDNYLEPIVASKAFSVSPFVMLVAFFFWGFLWGIPGAFIGLPMTIALVTICQQTPSTRWIVRLLST